MRKIKEILRLHHEAGLSERQIARSLRISHNSVGRYVAAAQAAGLSWPLPEEWDEDDLRRRLFPDGVVEREPSKPLPDMAAVHKELRRRHATLRTIWERYRMDHPTGYGYTQFAHYYNRWRDRLDVTMRLPHAAGEELFVDWAGSTLP